MPLIELTSNLSRKDSPQKIDKIIGRPSPRAIIRDAERITKFIISPKGLIFTAKQFAQQLMNPNTENVAGKAGFNLTKVYDPISPITNTVGAPLGLRTDRHMPPIVRSKLSTYEGTHKVRAASGNSTTSNRLIRLKNELLSPAEDDSGPKKLLKFIQKVSNAVQGFKGQTINTLSSLTGPQSIGGIGATTIRRYEDTSKDAQSKFTTSEPKGRGAKIESLFSINKTYEANIDNDFARTSKSGTGLLNTGVFLKVPFTDRTESDDIKPKNLLGEQPETPGHSKLDQKNHIVMPYNNIPTRIGKKELLDFRVLRKDGDTDAARYTEESNRVSNFGNTLRLIDTIDASVDESLIDFRFNDIAFKAYLGAVSDNFAPSWNNAEDQGRADARYQYAGFERTITFDFMVVAYNKDQLEIIWRKLQDLARLTYPVYGSQGFFGQSTNVTIGKLFDERPMIIQDLGYDWDNETPWEIDEDYQSPLYTTVSMTCVVLGDRPQSDSILYDIKGLSDG